VKGPRPARLVVVVGTGTDVGKTWVSAQILTDLRKSGVTVAARKPAQSFDPLDDTEGLDSAVLGAASGEPPEVVCLPHRNYEVAMAPPMAASFLGRPAFTVDDLLAEMTWPTDQVKLGLIETAGGVRSPQAGDGDAVTMVQSLAPDIVLLIADAGLGTINSVRLSMQALSGGCNFSTEIVVILNRYSESNELHVLNRRWLTERGGLRLIAIPSELSELRALVSDA
jgi:dethiobiotin synthetase